jgi:hypothetical protein
MRLERMAWLRGSKFDGHELAADASASELRASEDICIVERSKRLTESHAT